MVARVHATPDFWRLVTEAMTWFRLFGPDRLWTPELMALVARSTACGSRDIGACMVGAEIPARIDLVASVVSQRAAALRRKEAYPPEMTDELGSGRLLRFSPDDSLSDGAAALASKGVFDEHNTPSPETWLYYTIDEQRTRESADRIKHGSAADGWLPVGYTSYLVCWVPTDLLHHADAGIAANPEGCLGWLSDIAADLPMPLGKPIHE